MNTQLNQIRHTQCTKHLTTMSNPYPQELGSAGPQQPTLGQREAPPQKHQGSQQHNQPRPCSRHQKQGQRQAHTRTTPSMEPTSSIK